MTEATSNLIPDDSSEDSWKSEISSRLDSYRTKNNRKLTGDFSMRFDFDGEPAGPRQPICVPIPPVQDSLAQELVLEEPEPEASVTDPTLQEVGDVVATEPAEPEQALPPEPPPPLKPSVPFKRKIRMEANVIEFPRLFALQPPPSQALAEPVLPTSPRILDAPEIAEPLLETPILEGMRLEHLERDTAPKFELPLRAAPVQQRAMASIYDCALVLVATAIFGFIASHMLSGFEWTKPMLAASLMVPVVLWAMYQYLFIVYGARTPGMAMTHLAFSTFQGTAPNLKQRRKRVLAMAVSCSSLMLGFVWAFFDEDTLCWHDRISRTYSFEQNPR